MTAYPAISWKPLMPPVLLLLVLLHAWPSAAAAKPEPSGEHVAKQYQQATAFHNHLASGAYPGERERWLRAGSIFQRLYRDYPAHELAPACLFMLGRLYHQMSRRFDNPLDLGQATAYYQDLAQLFPEHPLADDALYQMAAIYLHDKKISEEAARIFSRIIADYPRSDTAAAAAVELEKIREPPARTAEAPKPSEPPLLQPAVKKTGAEQGFTRIKPVRYWSTADYTRVVIETGEPVGYKHSILPQEKTRPPRLYVDLQNSRLGPGMEASVPIGDGLLKQIRTAQFSPASVRVVLDLESVVDYQVFNLQDPFRVVIDARGKLAGKQVANIAPDRAMNPSLPQQLGLGIRKIVLDPGHGGKDPGAIGPSGIKEKDIVLAVAKKLADHLQRELGCEIIFTRDRDVFVPLEERTAIANTSGADLFVSIHANAAPSASLRGIETYFLDFATSKDAMRVAARENATSALQMSDLQSILMDLMQNTKITESARLAELVHDSIIAGMGRHFPDIHDLGVKRAPFVVLIGAHMPAVLTEISFLSNPEEERRLTDSGYQEKLAAQIAAGISRYATDLNLAGVKLFSSDRDQEVTGRPAPGPP